MVIKWYKEDTRVYNIGVWKLLLEDWIRGNSLPSSIKRTHKQNWPQDKLWSILINKLYVYSNVQSFDVCFKGKAYSYYHGNRWVQFPCSTIPAKGTKLPNNMIWIFPIYQQEKALEAGRSPDLIWGHREKLSYQKHDQFSWNNSWKLTWAKLETN